MTELYENCYRLINIAYVNQVADACKLHGIDVDKWSALLRPSLLASTIPSRSCRSRVGGHCIPVNPFYLLANNALPLLEKATKQM